MNIEDWEWLLSTAAASEDGALSEPIDVRRLKLLAPECSLSKAAVARLLKRSGAKGLLAELNRRVCEGRAALQEAVADLDGSTGRKRSEIESVLKRIASTDPYVVNRKVAKSTLESIERGRYG